MLICQFEVLCCPLRCFSPLRCLVGPHKKELEEEQKKVKENNEKENDKLKRKAQNLNVSVTHKKIRLRKSQLTIHEAFSKTKNLGCK